MDGGVILASTGQVIDGHLRDGNIPVTPDSPPRPRYLYACTKVFLEALGQVYSRQHGVAVLVVRLGWCPRDGGQVAEIAASELAQDVFLSPGDAGRFFAAAVEARALPPFAVVYATSRFTHALRYDLTETKRLQFRALMTNALNHPNFSNPAANISSPGTVGQITSTFAEQIGEDARQIHFSLRFEF